jgi:hypothetical protein
MLLQASRNGSLAKRQESAGEWKFEFRPRQVEAS